MKKEYRALLFYGLFAAVAAATLWGCDAQDQDRTPDADAVAVLMPTEGNTVTGTVSFSKTKEGVRVIARIDGLSPGPHGFHIHEFGDCRAANGSSAGGHFNPHDAPHGAPDTEKRHVGDLGNIVADEKGTARLDRLDAHLSLDGENGIIGRGVVVHAGEDNFKTQPHGGAGKRLACGTIGIAGR
jgi:superoxide dismutase, Cu-Zn family